MSTVQTSEQYQASYLITVRMHCIRDNRGFVVDRFRSRCAAEYAARLLNAGVASVDPHAIVGCKVVAA